MYLDFIVDIAKIGDSIIIKRDESTITGVIVKLSSKLIAIKNENDVLFVIRDEEIQDVQLNPGDGCKIPNGFIQNTNSEVSNKSSNITINTVDAELDMTTIGVYDTKWDDINKDSLIAKAYMMLRSLTPDERNFFVYPNANVREILHKTFRVETYDNYRLSSVRNQTIIEKSLIESLKRFAIGDSLPVVIYYNEKIKKKAVFLTLLPNTIEGYVDILIKAISENHYNEAKSLCYFLLSYLRNNKAARSRAFAIMESLKTVNPFIIQQGQQIAPRKKVSKGYKTIEQELNTLISSGKHSEAINKIDTILLNEEIDVAYRSNLLLRKAQAYSSLKDYEHARLAYMDLISFKESIRGEPKNLSHLYTELARLQAMDEDRLAEAIDSAERAISYNPQNAFANTLLSQLKSGAFTSISITNPTTSNQATSDEDKELMLEAEETSLVISSMIDIDIREHNFTNEEIINNGGVPTVAIATSIYEEAKKTKDVDLSERYPVYLEAAKAFSELPVGSYSTQDYIESIAYYAILKGNSLFVRFRKLLSEKNCSISQLTHIKDSACSYYIESLNLLSSIQSEFLLTILRNYLKMNIALANMKDNVEPNMSGQFNKLFFYSIDSINSNLNHIAWSTIVTVGTASPKAWNKLTTIKGGTRGLYRIMRSSSKRQSIYETLNSINIEQIDTELLPGEFLKKSFQIRNKRIKKLGEIISYIVKSDFNVLLLNNINDLWSTIPLYSDLFNETEVETKLALDRVLLILKPYSNRNQVERTNILIQVQREIDKQIAFINDNTTFYGRTFFFPLLIKWKRTISKLLEKKISDTLPQLIVLADPPYIVQNGNRQVVNLIIKNVGESTAEGCIMIPTIEDIDSGESIKGKNSYNSEIPAGANLDVPMNLPPQMYQANSIKLSMSISAIYQGKELPPKEFNFTIEREPESSLTYNDIPWKDGPIPAEHMFKGRQKLLNELNRHYTSIEKDKPYILYGLTRTGKSSILKYLGISLNKKEILIDNAAHTIATFDWDLSQASSFGNAQDMWEYLLKEQIYENLNNYISIDDIQALSMPDKPRAKDLSNALRYLKKMNIYPIFLVDEFSYIKGLIDNNTVNPAFLHTLRKFSLEGLASFIYAGTYDIKALLKDKKYGITGQLVNAIEQQIAEIDPSSAEELINVLGSKLRFTAEAITHIHKLSGDVPYFVQMICKYCGIYAVERKRSIIGYPELEYIVRVLTGETNSEQNSMVKTLPENVFQNNMFSPADPIEVNVLISSFAYINRNNRENPRGVGVEELQELWATKSIEAYRPMLAESIELLCQKKVLLTQEDEGLPVYKISVDLFRRWWAVHNPDINLQLDKVLKL